MQNREMIMEVAERAVSGGASNEDLLFLDTIVRETSNRTGRTVQQTADFLRLEAFIGPHYRGELFDADS